MEQVTDEIELLHRSAAGDREAFGLLVERHQTLVYTVAYSATGNMEKSEELAQETFLRAWQNLRQLREPACFRGWLCTIARNLASRVGRNQTHDVLTDAGPLEGTAVPAPTPGPVEILIRRERQEIVWSALRRIPLRYREPMVLFYSAGRSVREVADELELSEHVVRQRLYRGRQLLNAEVSSLVEDTLTGVRPGRAFAATVVALLPTAAAAPAAGAVIVGAKSVPAARILWGSVANALLLLLGPILGLLGAIAGFRIGIRSVIRYARSPRERRFMIEMSILAGLLMTALIIVPPILALVGMISWWVVWICLSAFFPLSLLHVVLVVVHVLRTRIEDRTYSPPSPAPGPPRRTSAAGFCVSSAGGIFVAVAWPLLLAGISHDWAAFAIILTCAILTALVTVYLVYGHEWRTAAAWFALAAAAGLLFAVVNLRWDIWIRAGRQRAYYVPVYDIPLRVLNAIMVAAVVLVGIGLWVRFRRRKIGNSPPDS